MIFNKRTPKTSAIAADNSQSVLPPIQPQSIGPSTSIQAPSPSDTFSLIECGDVSFSSLTSDFTDVSLPSCHEEIPPAPSQQSHLSKFTSFARRRITDIVSTSKSSTFVSVSRANSGKSSSSKLSGSGRHSEEPESRSCTPTPSSSSHSTPSRDFGEESRNIALAIPATSPIPEDCASASAFQPISPSSPSLTSPIDPSRYPHGRRGDGPNRTLITNLTMHNVTQTTQDRGRGFGILSEKAAVHATANAHHRWKVPRLSAGSPDPQTIASIVEQVQRPYTKESAITWLHCPDPSRATTISRLVAHRLRESSVITATYFAQHACDCPDTTCQIIPTLAYQILKGIPEAHAYLPYDDQGVYGSTAEAQLDELIIRPLNGNHEVHCPGARSEVLIIIDDLDQVDRRWASYLLDLFVTKIQRGNLPSVRIFVTSQYHRRFETLLTGPAVRSMTNIIALH